MQNKKTRKKFGFAHDDIDLISTLQPDLLTEICEYLELNNTGCDIGLEDFLTSLKLQILKEILSKLQISGKSEKWADYSEEDLFPNMLMEKDTLMSFTSHDLDIIIGEIESYSAQNLFTLRQQGYMCSKNCIPLWKWATVILNPKKSSSTKKFGAKYCGEITFTFYFNVLMQEQFT